jgi:hypothetical protein
MGTCFCVDGLNTPESWLPFRERADTMGSCSQAATYEEMCASSGECNTMHCPVVTQPQTMGCATNPRNCNISDNHQNHQSQQARRVVWQYPRLAEEEKVFLWIDVISCLSGLNVKTRPWALYASFFFVLNTIKVSRGQGRTDRIDAHDVVLDVCTR